MNLADGQGVTPLAHAQDRGYAEMVEILRDAGATPSNPVPRASRVANERRRRSTADLYSPACAT